MAFVRYTAEQLRKSARKADLSWARAMTDKEIMAAAASDPDAAPDMSRRRKFTVVYPPMTGEEVAAVRAKTGLSQDAFSRTVGIPAGTIRGWEQGRRVPDPAATALLRLIGRAPDMVLRLLREDAAG